MKLLRYGPMGNEKPGLLDANGQIRDLSNTLQDIDGAALSPASLARLRALDPTSLPLVPGNPRIGSPIAIPGCLIGIGLNYRDHAAEAGKELPTSPVVFLKPARSVSGPHDNVVIARTANKLDWEVELGIVIGTAAKYVVTADQAASHIAGYCVVHDVSERAFQLTGNGGQWTLGKCGDGGTPVGPWLVTADDVGDPQKLHLWLKVNGIDMQDGNTADMIFSCAEIVSFVSQYMTLQPGDIIATGTPAGVGAGKQPPVFLKDGDVVRLGIDGLGEQQQTFVKDV